MTGRAIAASLHPDYDQVHKKMYLVFHVSSKYEGIVYVCMVWEIYDILYQTSINFPPILQQIILLVLDFACMLEIKEISPIDFFYPY